MTATSEVPHLLPLGAHTRTEIGRELEATLLELVDLSLLGNQLRWSLSGPLAPVLHRHLDELVESWRGLASKAAERAITIGYWPDGQADAVAARDEHAAVARGPVEDQAVVSLLVQFLAAVTERTRGATQSAGCAGCRLATGADRSRPPAGAAALDGPRAASSWQLIPSGRKRSAPVGGNPDEGPVRD